MSLKENLYIYIFSNGNLTAQFLKINVSDPSDLQRCAA